MTLQYTQGKYKLINESKYIGDKSNIVFRSSWELKMMNWCDKNASVLKWGSEIHPIPYYSSIDNKVRRYFPDFWLLIRNTEGIEQKIIIEVKPYKETLPPTSPKKITKKSQAKYINERITYERNQDKWKAAREFAIKHNMQFKIMTEYELGIKKRGKST